MSEQKDFHYQWLERSVERLEERRKEGHKVVDVQIGELQRIFMELMSMHTRCDRLESMLYDFARCQHPAPLFLKKELL